MDLPPPGPDEPVYRNMHGPNPWPEEAAVPGFRQAVKTYLEYIRRVTDEFKVLVAEALDLKSTAFLDFFDEQCTSRFTLNKYSLPKSTGPVDKLQGHLAHTDGSFLTFLLQGTTHGGLEVQNKSGVWIPVPPLPGTLVVNLGRQMESVTGRICTATTHRVTLSRRNFTSPDGCTLGPRFSFALFQNLSLDLSRDAMSVEIPAHISRLVHGEQPKSDAKRWFCDSSKPGTAIGDELFAVRVLRHPEVGQKWYPDILAKARAHQAARN
ncbi:hypothetical protein BDV37DRAFT_263734 [Aspergillus pseudonomiae]|uniref:Fe2OG dioxygenase domain-containing protein n=1 Tax=Aspergillus pseudonomiae TaxID=1506151 RepID=A0A5N7CWC0_9EURO|nr:uncharacterized protein BDV37DRAFT_263734 [Aspergillus pseudonomiae]KAE8398259.1 hypothetical protein BDV37DRAFT_263734 [Aspergillus pseudonomiae]